MTRPVFWFVSPCIVAAALFLLSGAQANAGCLDVVDYNTTAWDVLTTANVDTLVQDAATPGRAKRFFLRPGNYFINNPVVIRRPLAIHGPSPALTKLIPLNPGEPIFVVPTAGMGYKADWISIAGVDMTAPTATDQCEEVINGDPVGNWHANQVAIRLENSFETCFEMYDASVTRTSIEIAGKGTFRLQHVAYAGHGFVNAPVLIDNPDADVTIVGGVFVNVTAQSLGTLKPHPCPDLVKGPFYHAWQRQGRFRVFGTGAVATWGNADFRIETAATAGPHVIAGVRSEGVKRQDVPYHSSLLYVPPSTQQVDVVLQANDGSWAVPDDNGVLREDSLGASSFVNYNAAGKVWLLGNHSRRGVSRLAAGNAPNAEIVALGNVTYAGSADDAEYLPIEIDTPADKIRAGNLYSWAETSKCELSVGICCNPRWRFANPVNDLSAYPNPDVPEVTLPKPILRPELNAPLAGMLDVRDCGADPTDEIDDAAAINMAFKAALLGDETECGSRLAPIDKGMVYFPAGTYKVSTPLLWYHHSQGEDIPEIISGIGSVGWIVGAGSGATTIEATQGTGTFQTSAMWGSTFQGITFKADPYVHATPSTITNVSIEYDRDDLDSIPPFASRRHIGSQRISFHDCVFDGGKYALGIAVHSPTQMDDMMMLGSKFKNAKYGYAQAGQNALGNVIYDPDPDGDPVEPTFNNNRYALGNPLACPGCVNQSNCSTCEEECPNATSEDSSGDSEIPPGGQLHVLGATIRNTGVMDISRYGGGSPWYFLELDTATEVLHDRCFGGVTSAPAQLFFDQSILSRQSTPADRPMFDWRSGGGPFFLHTTLDGAHVPGRIEFNGSAAAAYAFNVAGATPWAWDEVQAGTQIHKVYDTAPLSTECDPGCGVDLGCVIEVCEDRGSGPECVRYPHDLLCDDGNMCTGYNQYQRFDHCDDAAGCVQGPIPNNSCCPDCPDRRTCGGPECQWADPTQCFYDFSEFRQCLFSGFGSVPECGTPAQGVGETVTTRQCLCDSNEPGANCAMADQTFQCACDPGTDQCSDGLFCNGLESCESLECEGGAAPCNTNDTCLEHADGCFKTCPDEWCDSAPTGPLTCIAADFGASSCASDYGELFGCPEGQVIKQSSCDCDGNSGSTSWFCGI